MDRPASPVAAPQYRWLRSQGRSGAGERVAIALILLGLIALYAPVVYKFGSQFLWDQDDGHTSFLLVMVIWAYWSDRAALTWTSTARAFRTGWIIIVGGLLLYLLGRTTNLLQLQGFSLPIIATGLTLTIGGVTLVKRWWLLSVLLVFIVPWLGPIADVLLVPLRLGITRAAVHVVGMLGFPVSATGVLIDIGFVRINVAGACVGLRSMVSLTAIGVLFLHFFPPRSKWLGFLFIVLLPIVALGANFIRICYLIITAGISGASGEAMVHDGAAYAEVVVSIVVFMLLGKAMSRKTVQP